MNEPREIDVFNRHERFSKLKVVGISLLIAIVIITSLYFLVKTLLVYTVDYNLNGGYVYGSELKPQKLKFLEKVQEPKGVKKEGYYIEYWSKDKDLGSKFTFGTSIWSSMTLHVKWADGVAVRLHFAAGEENSDLSLQDLKGYYEDWLKPGSDWSLPLIFNEKQGSVHMGEQLLWYDNAECTGDPFATRSWENLTETVDIYGRWFDTKESKFNVDENGVLLKYKGHCNKVILPSKVIKIKDIDPLKFTTGESDTIHDQAGTYHSAWQNVMDDETGVNGLKIIYLNAELVEIGDCAFKDCKGLETVKFMGDNVEVIGQWAFANCINLKEITIPSKVTKIENNTFDGAFKADAQVSLDLKNVTHIADKAFINSKIYNITMPSLTTIGSNAFAACHVLHDFVITSDSVVTSNVTGEDVTKGIFFDTYTTTDFAKHLTIYVPSDLYSGYIAQACWSMYSDDIETINK